MIKKIKLAIFGPRYEQKNLVVGQISASEIPVGTLGISVLHAGTVTADKLRVTAYSQEAERARRQAELLEEYQAFKPRYKIKERPDGTWEILKEAARLLHDSVIYHWQSIHQQPAITVGYLMVNSSDYPDYFHDYCEAEHYLIRLTNPQEVLYDSCGNEIEDVQP